MMYSQLAIILHLTEIEKYLHWKVKPISTTILELLGHVVMVGESRRKAEEVNVLISVEDDVVLITQLSVML